MILLTEDDARPLRDDWPRKGGRIIVQDDGQTIECYSPSALPSYLGGGFSAPTWSARCAAKGAGLRPDLAVMAAPLDIAADKHELDAIVAQLEEAGGRSAAANRGTAMHSAIRRLLRGLEPEMPDECQADIDAIRAVLDEWGIVLVDGMDEVQLFTPPLPGCGQADAIVTSTKVGPGRIVADAKTGSFKPLDAAIQMSVYAHATHTCQLVDDAVQLTELDEPFRADIGLVLHAPYGKGQARIIAVDLIEGWRLAQLAVAAHRETLDSGRVVIKDLPPSAPTAAKTPQIDPPAGPSLHARVGDLRRRAKVLAEQGLLTSDEAMKMCADTGVPPLTQPDQQTADTLDVWEGFVATVELGLSTYGRTDDYLRRLKALPVDLLAHATMRAKELDPPVPNLTAGKVTGPDLDRLEAVLAPIELVHAERVATVTQHLAELDDGADVAVVEWATEGRDTPSTTVLDLDNLEAERVIALCHTYTIDDLEQAIRQIGTAAKAKAIAKQVAARHQIPLPTSARAIASDRVLAGLVLTNANSTTPEEA
jgi:hypothetical protein